MSIRPNEKVRSLGEHVQYFVIIRKPRDLKHCKIYATHYSTYLNALYFELTLTDFEFESIHEELL